MKNPIVIAVAGPKGAGKTSLCRLLAATYARALRQSPCEDERSGEWDTAGLSQYPGQAHERVILTCRNGNSIPFTIDPSLARIASFAAPLKRLAEDVLGIDGDLVYGDDARKSAPTDYLWDHQHVWVRWINSPDRGFTVVGDPSAPLGLGISDMVYSISCESQLWKACALHGCEPSGMRSGHMTVREILQILGTDVFRNTFDNAVWIRALERDVRTCGSSLVLIDDVRFDGELEAVARMGGAVIRFEGCGRGGHESERGISDAAMARCAGFASVPHGERSAAAVEGVRLLRELYECRMSMKRVVSL
jgi:hypothetical protein